MSRLKDVGADLHIEADTTRDAASVKSEEAEPLDVLTLLVEHDEKKHFPIANPDPIELIEYVMESRGLSRKDIEPMIGLRG